MRAVAAIVVLGVVVWGLGTAFGGQPTMPIGTAVGVLVAMAGIGWALDRVVMRR